MLFLLLSSAAQAAVVTGHIPVGSACNTAGDTGFSDVSDHVLLCNGSSWTSGGITPSFTSSLTSATSALTTTETSFNTLTIPANILTLGATIRVKIFGTCTTSSIGVSNIRVRLGKNNTTGDAIVAAVAPTSALTGSAVPFSVELLITMRSIGAAGVSIGQGQIVNNGSSGITSALTGSVISAPTTAAVDTTSVNYINVTYQSASSSTSASFQLANIQISMP